MMNPGVALPGPHRAQAIAQANFCLEQGMSYERAYCIACMASIGEFCWAFQARIAKFTGYCVRTVQRAVRQAKKMGVLISRRLRRGEQPKGANGPISCGGAMRRFTAWGMGAARMLARCAKWALRWIWREEAWKRRQERERSELSAALADLRGPPT